MLSTKRKHLLFQHIFYVVVLECGGIAPYMLNLSTSYVGVVSFTPRPLYHRGTDLGTYWTRGSVVRIARLDVVARRKVLMHTSARRGT
jgi:hypothetical protein